MEKRTGGEKEMSKKYIEWGASNNGKGCRPATGRFPVTRTAVTKKDFVSGFSVPDSSHFVTFKWLLATIYVWTYFVRDDDNPRRPWDITYTEVHQSVVLVEHLSQYCKQLIVVDLKPPTPAQCGSSAANGRRHQRDTMSGIGGLTCSLKHRASGFI
ncbi:hypothetical protein EVAR_51788_1 [Eumeta japonica]|uniref:Uncharacterized protein n=1 Tax=Eumeta variegata TaxID=151549 RepID=A0A4C1XAY7_EUMVA|nr:hypothetical protein EVAR_51788_1 [Eumeta japonica]